MPESRPSNSKTKGQRAIEAANAAGEIAELLDNPPALDDLEGWEKIEKLGAIVHRQARLLAGKSKGG